jgi:hypothetical protein
MSICIYCLRPDPACGFTREHVLQGAFGSFRGALTLPEEVCADCNQYLGDHLDRVLARDSLEAVLRIAHGLKDPATMSGMFKSHITIRLPRDGKMWGGAHVELTAPPPGREGLGGRPVPQVGFERRDGSGWDYLTEHELRAAGDLSARFDTEYQREIKHVVGSDEDAQRLIGLMREHGVPLKGDELDREISREGLGEANITWIFDRILARPIAKIALNYLAKTQGAAFALRPEFDDVRRFVRADEGRPFDFVRPQPGSIVDPWLGYTSPRGHLIQLSWTEGRRLSMICRLTLFDQHVYLVRLCTAFYGPVWLDVRSAHLYDLEARECRKDSGTPLLPLVGLAL